MSDGADSAAGGTDHDDGVTVAAGGVRVSGTDQRLPVEAAAPDDGWDLDELCRLALRVLVGEGVGRGRLDLHLADPDTMAELKGEHFGEDVPTDVLAFPLDDPDDPLGADPLGELDGPLLGDVVLCPTVARGQAAGAGGDTPTAERYGAEMRLLCVHGVLHVLGHDHAEPGEQAVMQERERHYLGGPA